VIEVRNLVKYYGDFPAVKDITFSVEKGEILGFLGPNAAGKTTTMRIITGYMPATRGTVKVAGYDVFEHPLEVKKRIGYLPENPPLYMDMRVRDYLKFVAEIKGVDRKGINAEVERVAELVSITHVLDRYTQKLSKGYRQRVGLAQALINNPPVLILDEPTIGLDPKQIIEVRELIRSLGSEHTIILSTHILPEVSMTCSRVVIINEGKLVAMDTPENLTARLQGSETVFVEVEGPIQDMLGAIEKMEEVISATVEQRKGDEVGLFKVQARVGSDIRKKLASLVVNSNWGLLELRPEKLSLEEIFLKLTTKEEELN